MKQRKLIQKTMEYYEFVINVTGMSKTLNVSKQNEVQNNYLWHETINKIFRLCNVDPTQPISSCRQPFPSRSAPKILFIFML